MATARTLWDICVQCDNVIEARRPDIIEIDKKERKGIINNNNKKNNHFNDAFNFYRAHFY